MFYFVICRSPSRNYLAALVVYATIYKTPLPDNLFAFTAMFQTKNLLLQIPKTNECFDLQNEKLTCFLASYQHFIINNLTK